MKYTNKTFSAPVAGSKVSQKQWDAIWLNKVKASRKKSKS